MSGADKFLEGRAEKKRKRKLKSKEKASARAKERYKTNRYLFKQWLRQQFQRKKIPWDYFRRYSINHQCYLWMIERGAGILCGDHPGHWNGRKRKRHEKFFTYLNRHFYQMLQVPEAPSSDTELTEALKGELPWMERQDMRQIIAIALWEKYGDLNKLPWAEKGSRNISYRFKSYLWWSLREVARQRCYAREYNADELDAESIEASNLERHVLFLQSLGICATTLEQYLTYLYLLQEGIDCHDIERMVYIRNGVPFYVQRNNLRNMFYRVFEENSCFLPPEPKRPGPNKLSEKEEFVSYGAKSDAKRRNKAKNSGI